jgi:predicted mannosyl-3-phosphoglycerate phosphatase (HAD superfamily)
MDRITSAMPSYLEKLQAVWDRVTDYALRETGYKLRLVEDFGSLWYGVVKHRSGAEAPLKVLLDEVIKEHPYFVDGSLYWHLNGNNLAVLPKIINKETAVGYLLDRYRRRHPELLTFGAGDSRTDAAFISLCDYALIPKNTQLFKTLAVTG